MRHILSVLVALVLTPIVYIVAGISAVWFTQAASGANTDMHKALLGFAAALIAGGLYAVLVLARLSPVGTVLAGLLLVGVGAWVVIDQSGFTSAVPATLLGVTDSLHAAAPFATSLLAAPLLITVFSPRRWQPGAGPSAAGDDGTPASAPSPESAAPTYAIPVPATASYSPHQAYEPVNVDEMPTARDAPSLASLSPVYQPPAYSTPASSFPGFAPPSEASTPRPDDDPNRPRFGQP
jgi:hypothetical protein